jgi:3-hydroxyisobutyrate dehydrogenase-like beta-hydroxyacid dehydrogenase
VRLGFAGLGRMGLPMAINLMRFGRQVTVWNRTRSRCQPLAEQGAHVADTPSRLAAASDIIITMLADAAALEEVLAGPAGIFDGIRPGCLLVDMSTVGPLAAGYWAGIASQHGAGFVDAPVSGSVTSAESGALLTMVGGTAQQFARIQPVLAAMTARQTHLGPTGTGAAMKVALNMMIAATNQAVAETLLLAECLGIESASAYQVLQSSAVSSPFVSYKRDAYLSPTSSQVAFTVDLMRKDLALALSLARDHGLRLPGADAAGLALAAASARGFGSADMASVLESLKSSSHQEGPLS